MLLLYVFYAFGFMSNTKEGLLFHKIFKAFKRAVEEYGLIGEHDHILVGISGGKDSLALLELLGQYKRTGHVDFSMTALHVTMSNIPYQSDVEYLRSFAERCGASFLHSVTSFDMSTDKRKTPCFLCSWSRRKRFFDVAKELGCRKIALGHHKDDILRTLLMNLTFQGSFGTMPPLLKMDKFDMTIIRPLALIEEHELAELAEAHQYVRQKVLCPYETASHRETMKEVMSRLSEMNPNAKSSMWNAMEHVQMDYLPKKIMKYDE